MALVHILHHVNQYATNPERLHDIKLSVHKLDNRIYGNLFKGTDKHKIYKTSNKNNHRLPLN